MEQAKSKPGQPRLGNGSTNGHVELLVTSRSKRSTAGNRMQALLDQELDKDEMFEEVENDHEFQAQEEYDIVDSDFDEESSEGEGAEGEDEEAGEREMEILEKAQRKAARAKAVPLHMRRPAVRPPPGPKPVSAASPTHSLGINRTSITQGSEESATKRRKISFVQGRSSPFSSSSLTTATGSVPGAGGEFVGQLRTSSRKSTVQNKLETQEKIREAEQRKAALPVRTAPKKRPQLTQDALIAEALETEEMNRESLRKFLEQEEERKNKMKVKREKIEGPFIRWVSVGVRSLPVIVKRERERNEGVAEKEGAKSVGEMTRDPSVEEEEDGDGPKRGRENGEGQGENHEDTKDADTKGANQGKPDGEPNEVKSEEPGEEGKEDKQGKVDKGEEKDEGTDDKNEEKGNRDDREEKGGEGEKGKEKVVEMKPGQGMPEVSKESGQQSPLDAVTGEGMDDKGRSGTQDNPSTSSAAKDVTSVVPALTTASLTEDPVIAARAQAALERAKAEARSDQNHTEAKLNEKRGEVQARTLLSVERAPEDWDWVDEFRVLLGDHCQWDKVSVVPARNRPLRPRQTTCPITGLPAIYKDPRTGIAYANAQAYKTLTELLEQRYVWTGGQRSSEDATMGSGAAPLEMGCYITREDEVGAGGVFREARKKFFQSHATEDPRGESDETVDTGTSSGTRHKDGGGNRTDLPLGMTIALVPDIAPGDEEAIMAAAAQLPAGSTRSGRRGARSSSKAAAL
ncbi:YL1-domain-containing protein [Violaceomyces palustris]|uniref:YL1-domain-containing protein n=1 Tax=Violaceomyces palustris TaxID=1673888 RepID=A0ACD0NPP7_9BASI|nr:YL1-domain-containing protein [Violaceomyces palustris]